MRLIVVVPDEMVIDLDMRVARQHMTRSALIRLIFQEYIDATLPLPENVLQAEAGDM
jgi:hypothetical protein